MDPSHPGRFHRQIMLSEESSVFVAGSLVLMAWLLAVAVLCPLGGLWDQWVIMEFTELLLGRGVAIAKGVALGRRPGLIILLATYVDAVSVFLSLPRPDPGQPQPDRRPPRGQPHEGHPRIGEKGCQPLCQVQDCRHLPVRVAAVLHDGRGSI